MDATGEYLAFRKLPKNHVNHTSMYSLSNRHSSFALYAPRDVTHIMSITVAYIRRSFALSTNSSAHSLAVVGSTSGCVLVEQDGHALLAIYRNEPQSGQITISGIGVSLEVCNLYSIG